MRVLVTGVTGFAGGHLAEALVGTPGVQLLGWSRHGTWPADLNHLAGRVALEACDLSNLDQVESALRRIQPDRIVHLAGYAQVGASFREADAAWAGNLTATRHLFKAIAVWGGRPRILAVTSGMIYGDPQVPDQVLTEESPLRPANPYAASKAAADLVGYQATRFPGLEVVRARPFNHIGPRQSPQFAVAHFAKQIADAEKGRRPAVVETGNLLPRRDMTDVRDMVRAYCMLLEAGLSGEAYNIASGQAVSMQTILDRLLALSRVAIEIRQQPQLVRAVDQAAICGDSAKLRRLTGWAPRFSLDQTLAATLAFWREHE
jgi:GDP-4-dehydro-6-deoxy-D-mannose reductase